MTTMTDVSDGAYGYQTWSHRTAAPDAFTASGFQGQKITVMPSDCITAVRTSHALGADIRDGEVTDPDAYAFDTQFYAEEWQTMLRAVADSVGGCAVNASALAAPVAAGGAGAGAAPSGQGGTVTRGASNRALPATGGTPALLALGLLVGSAAVVRGRRA